MERHMMWTPWIGPGLEHLHIKQTDKDINADGLILGLNGQEPFRVRYEIRCDGQWRLRTVHLSLLSGSPQTLNLLTDGSGSWTNEAGSVIPSLSGCLDVDISSTPFTNTLPIRRLTLKPGLPITLSMVYIEVPLMQVTATEQRYTCLEITPGGGRYRYESLENGISVFTADLPVDGDGLVVDYPGLFKRVWG
jgi:hypothetical protein